MEKVFTWKESFIRMSGKLLQENAN